MIVKALVENTSISEEYGSEHGLSLYIKTKKHNLLFDMGKSDLFLKNAQKMDVNISDVDLAFISHGHYDHGGGLKYFLETNNNAKVYTNKNAFEKHYSKRPTGITDIGLDTNLISNENIILVNDYLRIDDELELFSNITEKELFSLSNKTLLIKDGDDYKEDTFIHEQNLIINEDGKTLLLAGCAHNGIVNIVEKYKALKGNYPDIVIGGFHLFNPTTGKSEDPSLINAIGKRLKETGSLYYTCHCTGLTAFEQLREVLDTNVRYLATGSLVEI